MLTIKALVIFFIGLAFGSYTNVLVDRGNKGKSLLKPSCCDHCGRKLKWFENIPVAGFFLSKGKSRCCKKKLSWQYPTVELASGLLFLLIGWQSGFLGKSLGTEGAIELAFLLFVGFLLLAILVWDLKYMIIPDELVIAGLIVSLFYMGYQYLGSSCSLFSTNCYLTANLLGGLIVGGFFYLLFAFSKGKWIGGGDVKLGFLVGFLVSWPMTYLLLLVTYVSGALVSIGLLSFKKKNFKSQIPFGPFIVFGTLVVLLWGERIVNWYRILINF